MASIALMLCPMLAGILLGTTCDVAILLVNKIPNVPSIAVLHGIGCVGLAVSYCQWQTSETKRRNAGGGAPDWAGVPGTFFFGGLTATGAIALTVAFVLEDS